MDGFLSQFLASVVIVAIGYLLKQNGYFSKNDGTALSKLVMNFTIPAAAICNISQVTLNAQLGSVFLVSFFHNILLLLVGYTVFQKRSRIQKGGLLLLVPGLSLSSFTLPLMEGLHKPLALSQVSMLDLGNSPVSLIGTYLIAAIHSSQNASLNIKGLFRSVLKTIPISVYLLTVFLNVTKIGYPNFVLDVAGIVAKANMPCSFLMLGVTLKFHFKRQEFLDLGRLLFLRYACGIFFGLLISALIKAEPMTRFVITVGLTAPLPLSAITYTEQFRYDTAFAAAFANATVIVSFFSAFFLYEILL